MAMKLRPSHPVGQTLGPLADRVRAAVHPAGEVPEVPEVVVTGVTLRSQDTQPGDLFAALPGASSHGGRYAEDAVRRGAVAVLTDADGVAYWALTRRCPCWSIPTRGRCWADWPQPCTAIRRSNCG